MLTRKNAQAYAVLAAIYQIVAEDKLNELMIEPYLNGRENGFAISPYLGNKKVVFSEYRNTDSIVVYTGTTMDFSMQGNTPTEETWKAGTFFPCLSILTAAKFIIEYLNLEV